MDHSQHARPEALVVMDHVEVAVAMGQKFAHAGGERQGLTEPCGTHDAEFRPVLTTGEFTRMRHAERVRVPVQVEARHRGEPHPGVEIGPRRPGEHLDRVAERDQFPGQMAGVHTLAPTAGITTVDKERDP